MSKRHLDNLPHKVIAQIRGDLPSLSHSDLLVFKQHLIRNYVPGVLDQLEAQFERCLRNKGEGDEPG